MGGIKIPENIIQTLKGFVNTTQENHGEGTTTFTDGKHYNIFNIKSGDIKIKDIANSLSKQCRYNGHVGSKHLGDEGEGFYSVAQHSVRMSEAALLAYGDVTIAFGCLIHDCGEHFTGDLVRPLKRILKKEGTGIIDTIEDNIDKAIFDYWGISMDILPVIKKIDYNIAQDEMTFLLKHQEIEFDYWLPNKAYRMFMAQHQKLEVLVGYKQKEFVKKDINRKYGED